MDLRIGHLYPDLMSIYGDKGNVIALSQRARWRGIAAEVRPYTVGEWGEPEWPDQVGVPEHAGERRAMHLRDFG